MYGVLYYNYSYVSFHHMLKSHLSFFDKNFKVSVTETSEIFTPTLPIIVSCFLWQLWYGCFLFHKKEKEGEYLTHIKEQGGMELTLVDDFL